MAAHAARGAASGDAAAPAHAYRRRGRLRGSRTRRGPQVRDADVLRILETQPRVYFAPGSNYRYSNSGYALLALVVEKASGTSFATFLRERIFLPLGMRGTVAFEEGVSTVPQRAFGYTA